MKQNILMFLIILGMLFSLSMNAQDSIQQRMYKWMYLCSKGHCVPKKVAEISEIYRSNYNYYNPYYIKQTFKYKTNVEEHFNISEIDSVTFIGTEATFSEGSAWLKKIRDYVESYGERLYGYVLTFSFKLHHISPHVKKVRCFIDADTTFNNATVKEVQTDICLGSRQTIIINLRSKYNETRTPYKDYPYLNIYRPVYVYMEYCYEMDGVSSVIRTPVKAFVIANNIDESIYNEDRTIEFLCSPDCPHVKLSRKCREDE